MWMSFITSGVKMRLRPRTVLLFGAVSSAMCEFAPLVRARHASPLRVGLENQLALRRFEVVVVVELLAADELLQLRRRAELVDAELPLHELGVGIGPLAGHAADAERAHLAADVDRAVVHGIPEAVADVSADDLAAALHHEAVHRAGAAEHDDGAALLVDARARPDPPLHDEVAAAERSTCQRAGVVVDHDDAGHHVLARRPADAALDVHLGAVDQAAAEVAQAALERDAAAREDPHPQRVARARVEHGDVADALLVEQPAQLVVDLARGELARVERRAAVGDLRDARDGPVGLDQAAGVVGHRCHTITSPSSGSYVSISRSITARIAISSDASATRSSDS